MGKSLGNQKGRVGGRPSKNGGGGNQAINIQVMLIDRPAENQVGGEKGGGKIIPVKKRGM